LSLSAVSVAVPPVVVDDPAPDRAVGGLLVGLAHGGPDGDALGIGVVPVGVVHHLPRHFRNPLGVGRRGVADALAGGERGRLRVGELRVGDEAQLVHPAQHVELARLRAARIGDRVVRGRRLRQSGQHRRLGDRDILQRLAVVDLCRGGEPVGALPEEDLVDVELEDLVLAQVGLDLPRQQHLAQLAGDGLLAGEEEVAGDLHRDGAGALLGTRGDVGERRAGHAQIVDTAMLVETLVLGGQNGLFHDIRDLADGHDRPPFLAELAQDLAFGRHDAQRDLGLVVGQYLEGRQGGPQQRQHESAEQGPDDPESQGHRNEIERPAF